MQLASHIASLGSIECVDPTDSFREASEVRTVEHLSLVKDLRAIMIYLSAAPAMHSSLLRSFLMR